MKIPKYISEALRLRRKFAVSLMKYSCIVDEFLIKNGIYDSCEDYDVSTGFEIYCNPYDSEMRIRKAIEEFNDDE